MTRTTHHALTSALPAIAAALALSSTPSLAQQVQPTEPAPVTESAPPPVTDATPATTDTTTAATTTQTTPSTTKTATKHTVRTTRTATPKPRATTTVARTQVTHHAAAAPAPAAAAPPPANTAETQPAAPNSESAVAPVVDLNSKPAGQKPASTRQSNPNQMLWIGGVALVLIALGGILVSLLRRRRNAQAWHEDWEAETEAEQASTTEPRHDEITYDEERGVVEPSAFAWAPTAPAQSHVEREDDDDRLPGETWVQRAYRGPSANNPSVSLKNRLRRAAFFDKRERDVAAGIAEPVDPNAGLPDAMAEEQEREFA